MQQTIEEDEKCYQNLTRHRNAEAYENISWSQSERLEVNYLEKPYKRLKTRAQEGHLQIDLGNR